MAFLGAGNDLFYDNSHHSTHSHDVIFGAAGDDTIRMQGGNDTAEGGAGANVFEVIVTAFDHGVFTDFELGVDVIGLDGALFPVD